MLTNIPISLQKFPQSVVSHTVHPLCVGLIQEPKGLPAAQAGAQRTLAEACLWGLGVRALCASLTGVGVLLPAAPARGGSQPLIRLGRPEPYSSTTAGVCSPATCPPHTSFTR